MSDLCESSNGKKHSKIMIGTRDSELAMKQTHIVLDKLKALHPTMSFEIVGMKTLGDQILDVSLSKIGSKALFTKELEVALETRSVDLVVHSLKDLPTTLPDGLIIGAVCERENPSDAVIVHPKHDSCRLSSLPSNSVIGTSSLRRSAQLKRSYAQLNFESIRGNLNTRLRKLKEGDKYDAIILAAAGIIRMGWKDQISQYLESSDCMYAVGQGAMAIECRENDSFILDLLSPLIHCDTLLCVCAERALMWTLQGGCSVPLAVNCDISNNLLSLRGGVWSLDGSEELTASHSCVLTANEENGASKISDSEEQKSEDLHDAQKSEDSHEPPSKKRKIAQRSYCGLAVPEKFSRKMLASYNLGVDVANLLLGKGAKKLLDAAKAANILPANVHPSKASDSPVVAEA